MIYPEKQTSWGWSIAAYLFLAGVGGSIFLFSFIITIAAFDNLEPVARLGCLIGPLLVLIGTSFLFFDLGSAGKTYLLFSSITQLKRSWMSRGSWILALFIIFGLLYSLSAFTIFEWLPWRPTTTLGWIIGGVASVLAIFTVAYPGFLLGVTKGIPFWNTPVLPALFFLSGLDTGLALLMLLTIIGAPSASIEFFHIVGDGDITLIVMVLIVVAAYIEIIRQGNVTANTSIQLLKTPLFIIGVLAIGLVIPLCLLIYSVFTSDVILVRTLSAIISIFILVGGFLLRYSIVHAGVFISLENTFPLPANR